MVVQKLIEANSFIKAQSINDEMLETPWRIKKEYLESRGWSAILLPFEIGDSIDGKPEESLIEAMMKAEARGYFALLTEGPLFPGRIQDEWNTLLEIKRSELNGVFDWLAFGTFLEAHVDDIDWCYAFDSSRDNFLTFVNEQAGLYNLVVPDSKSFLLLNVSADFHVIAGPREFIESAIGETLENARERVNTPGEYWDSVDEKTALREAALYESLDSQIETSSAHMEKQ
jgi:hypothetical protein